MGWYFLSVLWGAVVALLGTMAAYRAFQASRIAQMIEFDDVPMLAFYQANYPAIYLVSFCLAGAFLLFLAATGLRSLRQPSADRAILTRVLPLATAYAGLALIVCRFVQDNSSLGYHVHGESWLDWLVLVLALCVSWSLGWLIDRGVPKDRSGYVASGGIPFWTRLGLVYLLGCGAVLSNSVLDHIKFWNPDANGGYDYRRFFAEGEINEANLVLYSTSLLFASIAAIAGGVAFATYRYFNSRQQSLANAGLWTFALAVPWQAKILGEIEAENGWILPAVTMVTVLASLFPLIFVCRLMLEEDLAPADSVEAAFEYDSQSSPETKSDCPRRSELAFWSLLLFPVYPFVRPFRPPWRRIHRLFLTVLAAFCVGSLIWLVQKADQLFDFDDWRGMMHEAQFPFLLVLFSLFAACFAYLILTNVVISFERGILARCLELAFDKWRMPVTKAGIYIGRGLLGVGAVGVFALATWPFWGWNAVHLNVFARTVEFNDRHVFELKFLHWLFDADRDGYAAVLHGGDTDDFDPGVGAGGVAAPQTISLPVDEFEIADAEKAKAFPNLVLFFLEGVTPRAISAYGERRLSGGLVATPHIDSVARDGMIFRQARCYYPSTWDAWFFVNSGRYRRIEEMDSRKSFGTRYSRYANLYKILKLAGVNRWCHPNTPPYVDLFVPEDLRHDPFGDYDTSLTSEERRRGVWRGDKRAQRMVAFLDSLQPGDKFFMCEHMSDTHFPWERTPLERARELGFESGLERYEEDAYLPGIGWSDKYACYLQTITRMDAQIGLVLNKLKEKNLYDNTMIVIVSDHGCQWWEHEHLYYVSHLYEQSLLVPMIVKVPGLPGRGACDQPVLQMDILPTVMELAGVRRKNPNRYPMTCRSLLPLLRGNPSSADREQYWQRDMVLTTHYDMHGVIERFRHKLIFDRSSGTLLLFDLQDDPAEMHNLADERPDLLSHMLAKFRIMMERHKSLIGRVRDGEADDRATFAQRKTIPMKLLALAVAAVVFITALIGCSQPKKGAYKDKDKPVAQDRHKTKVTFSEARWGARHFAASVGCDRACTAPNIITSQRVSPSQLNGPRRITKKTLRQLVSRRFSQRFEGVHHVLEREVRSWVGRLVSDVFAGKRRPRRRKRPFHLMT
ncbi:MAG: hypothetical protein KatS3mg105_4353 [Gemmatales bacterium]|nr:MAG: hypothetical protein KatS3mg105_4353 [Gemmatales bacterium]